MFKFEKKENKIYEQAKIYDSFGYSIVPIRPNTKILAAGDTEKSSVKLETLTNTQVLDILRDNSNYNVGIIGRPNRDRIGAPTVVIVDLDQPKGEEQLSAEELQADLIDIADTDDNWVNTPMFAITPSNGLHLYYRLPEGVEVRQGTKIEFNGRKTNIDVKTGKGYVLASPSGINWASYRWLEGSEIVDINDLPELPKSLLDLITVKEQKQHNAIKIDTINNEAAFNACKEFIESNDCEGACQGERNDKLAKTARLIYRDYGLDLDQGRQLLSLYNEIKVNPPYGQNEYEQREMDDMCERFHNDAQNDSNRGFRGAEATKWAQINQEREEIKNVKIDSLVKNITEKKEVKKEKQIEAPEYKAVECYDIETPKEWDSLCGIFDVFNKVSRYPQIGHINAGMLTGLLYPRAAQYMIPMDDNGSYGVVSTNMYNVVVGGSGRGKSYGTSVLQAVLNSNKLADRYVDSCPSGQAIEKALLDNPIRLMIDDEFAQTERASTKSRENYKQQERSFKLKIKERSVSSFYRLMYTKLEQKEAGKTAADIHYPWLSILGNTTSENLKDVYPGMIDSGYLSRFDFVTIPEFNNNTNEKDWDDFIKGCPAPQDVAKLFKPLVDIHDNFYRDYNIDDKSLYYIDSTIAYNKVFRKVNAWINDMSNKATNKVLKNQLDRYSQRLHCWSLIYALGEFGGDGVPVVDCRYLRIALATNEYFTKVKMNLAKQFCESDERRIARQVLDYIKSFGDDGIAESLVKRMKGVKSDQVAESLEYLDKYGYIKRNRKTRGIKLFYISDMSAQDDGCEDIYNTDEYKEIKRMLEEYEDSNDDREIFIPNTKSQIESFEIKMKDKKEYNNNTVDMFKKRYEEKKQDEPKESQKDNDNLEKVISKTLPKVVLEFDAICKNGKKINYRVKRTKDNIYKVYRGNDRHPDEEYNQDQYNRFADCIANRDTVPYADYKTIKDVIRHGGFNNTLGTPWDNETTDYSQDFESFEDTLTV